MQTPLTESIVASDWTKESKKRGVLHKSECNNIAEKSCYTSSIVASGH